MPVPPSIDTRRLALRQFVADDWKVLHEHYSDLDCTRFTFGRALTHLAEFAKWTRTLGSYKGAERKTAT